MRVYEKPMVLANEELAEGVYAASGAAVIGCDSKYMNGNYQSPNYNTDASYGQRLGCTGCPAFSEDHCQLDDYHKTGFTSYEIDNGIRKPAWEVKGHYYDEPIDWNNYDM